MRQQADASATNPYVWSINVQSFVCPSFPGEERVPSFGNIPKTGGSKVAAGNYVALAATHYRSSPNGHLESGLPTVLGANAGGRDCMNGPYCGNGGLPFPGIVNGSVQAKGPTFRDLKRGTSKVAIVAESREERLTSWYSGLASYVVATMPPSNGASPGGAVSENGKFYWSCKDIPTCATALNKGSRRNTADYYQPTSPHGSGPRIWGPSSSHPSVVLHCFADSHTEASK
jgi:hypothetical protein